MLMFALGLGYTLHSGTRMKPSEDVKRVPKRMKEEAWLVDGKTINKQTFSTNDI